MRGEYQANLELANTKIYRPRMVKIHRQRRFLWFTWWETKIIKVYEVAYT